jgi:hypothetical protein
MSRCVQTFDWYCVNILLLLLDSAVESNSSACTSLTTWNGPFPQTLWWKMTAPLQPKKAEEIWLGPQEPHKHLQMHHWEHPVRLYHRLVQQLHCPQNTKVSGGLCSQPNASSGAHCLPSRTSTAPGVTGMPRRTRATACSPRYHLEGRRQYSTVAAKLEPRDW